MVISQKHVPNLDPRRLPLVQIWSQAYLFVPEGVTIWSRACFSCAQACFCCARGCPHLVPGVFFLCPRVSQFGPEGVPIWSQGCPRKVTKTLKFKCLSSLFELSGDQIWSPGEQIWSPPCPKTGPRGAPRGAPRERQGSAKGSAMGSARAPRCPNLVPTGQKLVPTNQNLVPTGPTLVPTEPNMCPTGPNMCPTSPNHEGGKRWVEGKGWAAVGEACAAPATATTKSPWTNKLRGGGQGMLKRRCPDEVPMFLRQT